MNSRINSVYLTDFNDHFIPYLSMHNNIKYLYYRILFNTVLLHEEKINNSQCDVMSIVPGIKQWAWKKKNLDFKYLTCL